jgi:hypothetical protein
MEPTITLELTAMELQDLRHAVAHERVRWSDLYSKAMHGEMPQNFSAEGARLIGADLDRLHDRLKVLSAFV